MNKYDRRILHIRDGDVNFSFSVDGMLPMRWFHFRTLIVSISLLLFAYIHLFNNCPHVTTNSHNVFCKAEFFRSTSRKKPVEHTKLVHGKVLNFVNCQSAKRLLENHGYSIVNRTP